MRPTVKIISGPSNEAAKEAIELFNATSSIPMLDCWEVVQNSMVYFLRKVYYAANSPLLFKKQIPTHKTTLHQNKKTCWVAFTGGKDSVAAAIKVERAGMTPILYHIAGLNRGMGGELKICETIADRMKWKLVVNKIFISGKKEGFIEMPTKNQFTALLMLANMVDSKEDNQWSAGFHESTKQERQLFGYDWTDGQDAIQSFNVFLSGRFLNSLYLPMLEGTLESWAICAQKGLLNFISGCVMQPRFKAGIRAANEKKFGKLLKGRCGSCYKCAWEQRALEKLNIIPPNPNYVAHGWKFISPVLEQKLKHKPTQAEADEWLMPAASVLKYKICGKIPNQPTPELPQKGFDFFS